MNNRSRSRFWAESSMAVITTLLFFLTVVRRDWIEAVFGIDPDAHTGSLEWLVTSGLLALTVVLITLAAIEWRRIAVAS